MRTEQPQKKHSLIYILLRRRYWLAAILITLVVWAGVSLAMRPD